MKRASIYIISLILLALTSCMILLPPSLRPVNSAYSNLDTLKFYKVSLNLTKIDDVERYWANDKEITKGEYEKFKKGYENISNCRPCYLRTYTAKDRLIRESEQYTDCPIGIWIEYHLSGTVKVIGHYKKNNTRSWKNIYDRGFCGVKHGIWNYYNSKGEIYKVREYKNGVLVE